MAKKAVSIWETHDNEYRGEMKKRMVILGYNAERLGQRVRMSAPTMRKKIRNPRTQTLEEMRMIIRVLGITPEEAVKFL